MPENRKFSQKDYFKKLQFLRITFYESTTTADTVQLAVFVRGIKAFYVFEEFLELIPIETTITRTDILKVLLNCFEAKNLNLFSLVNTVQLAVFVRGIKTFHVLEEFVELIPIKISTTGADILKTLLNCFEAKNLNLFRLVSITTDDVASMIGKNKRVMSLLYKRIKNNGFNNSIIKFQCLIHQKPLCAKVTISLRFEE